MIVCSTFYILTTKCHYNRPLEFFFVTDFNNCDKLLTRIIFIFRKQYILNNLEYRLKLQNYLEKFEKKYKIVFYDCTNLVSNKVKYIDT